MELKQPFKGRKIRKKLMTTEDWYSYKLILQNEQQATKTIQKKSKKAQAMARLQEEKEHPNPLA